MLRVSILIITAIIHGALFQTGVNAQEQKPLLRAELDNRVKEIIFENTKLGTQLFNEGKQIECYRVYQATISSLSPFLDHHPELVERIRSKSKEINSMKVPEAAFALREILDEISSTLSKSKTPLWDRLGGQKAVEMVIHDFVIAAATDPEVNFLRDGKFSLDDAGVKKLESRLVQLVSAVSGGPLKYEGKNMKDAHSGMKITDKEFDKLAIHLVASLKKYKVPQSEIDDVIRIISTTRKDIVEVSKKPLWDRLGGEKGVRAVVKEFLITASKDPKANIDRSGNYPLTPERVARVEQLVVEFISSVTGGQLKYTGRDMKNSHAGMKITEDEFNVSATHLIAALKKYQVPQAEIDELVGTVSSIAKDIIEVKK
ncbi:MAG: group 1 truncated hemoglobin [Gemmataceae bacterium]